MESDLDVDDPSSHANEQRAETWFLRSQYISTMVETFHMP